MINILNPLITRPVILFDLETGTSEIDFRNILCVNNSLNNSYIEAIELNIKFVRKLPLVSSKPLLIMLKLY